ncbi:hypothetical protein A2165_01980 [Candidatus Curtissbacteria bacterium RBG_13_40_7]|uniref:Glycosyl transferase family 1 domain-containing protein n=1 Tax=Candidatus Curtissbacteria bacterium RBG_13_40_7 TaxID=1797706 RepID=A0A1F5FU79_9BACT|nr:MAG: hypothetical protein A2165_01980 [Candidatus Curtissbacteria bacterium RBG_13_40_7]
MRVALDINPTITGHKLRGIGVYTQRLKEEFHKGNWPAEFEFFEDPDSPPPADVIHHPYFDLFFHTLAHNEPSGRVVTIHDVIPLVFPTYFPAGIRGYLNLFFQKKALKNVDAVICDSQTSKEDVIAKLSIPKDKIHVIYLAPGPDYKPITDKSFLSNVAKKYALPKEFILYVGDVNWNKNILNLLEAIKHARVNLVMVGQALIDKNLDQVKEINKKISKLGLQKKILRTGYIPDEDLIAIYNLASLTVLASFYEGFGLPVLESMACGTSVVCSKLASLPEIAGNLANFCDPEDPQDIAKKISLVLNLPQKEKQNISQNLIRHASKFTWHKVAQQTINVYKKVYENV